MAEMADVICGASTLSKLDKWWNNCNEMHGAGSHTTNVKIFIELTLTIYSEQNLTHKSNCKVLITDESIWEY